MRFRQLFPVVLCAFSSTPCVRLSAADVFAGLLVEPREIFSGGPTAKVKLTLLKPAPRSGLSVRFFTDKPGSVLVPPVVLVPAGQTRSELQIAVSSTVPTTATIWASAGGSTASAGLTVMSNGTRRGFINDDAKRDISDATYLLNHLFSGTSAPRYKAYADINGDARLDISDAVALLWFLFAGTEVAGVCDRPIPTGIRLDPEVATDGQQVCLQGSFPDRAYHIVLTGYKYTQGPLVDERNHVVISEREAIYSACIAAVRTKYTCGADGEQCDQVCFEIPMDAPSGEYEVLILPAEGECPRVASDPTNRPADACEVGPYTLFITPAHIVSELAQLIIGDNSEPSGSHPAELFLSFSSYTGSDPDQTGHFPVEFSGSYPGGRPGSQHLTNADGTVATPHVPLFVAPEQDMERTECEEECAAAADPARCRQICAENARHLNNRFVMTAAGAEFDCLDGCSSVWDEVANIGLTALGCLAGYELGETVAGCKAGSTLGGIAESALEDALEDEDDVLGTADFTFPRGTISPYWKVGEDLVPTSLSKADMGLEVRNYRLGGPLIKDAKVTLKSVYLIQADDDDCYAPDELFFETRATLCAGSHLGDATRLPGSSGLPVAQGQRRDLSSLSPVDAGGDSIAPILYVEVGVWDDDGDDENELIGLHSTTYKLSDFASDGTGSDFSIDGHPARRIRKTYTYTVSGFNSDERCDCEWPWACGWDAYAIHGKAEITYEVEVIWLKYPSAS